MGIVVPPVGLSQVSSGGVFCGILSQGLGWWNSMATFLWESRSVTNQLLHSDMLTSTFLVKASPVVTPKIKGVENVILLYTYIGENHK